MRWLAMAMAATTLTLTGAACGGRDDEALVGRAKAALDPFKKALRGTLEEALAAGPEAAITACADLAPQLAAQASTPAARVGRTSQKLRNPVNGAPAWLAPALAGLDGPRLVTIDATHVGYAEPIKLQEVCVTCHGKDVAPAVRERLAARYPGDAATGYAVGDVRGAFWVELDTTR